MKTSESELLLSDETKKKSDWLQAFPPSPEYLNGKSLIDIYMLGFKDGGESLIQAMIRAGGIDNTEQERADRRNQTEAERDLKRAREYDRLHVQL